MANGDWRLVTGDWRAGRITIIANPRAGWRQPAWHEPVRRVLSALGDVHIVTPGTAEETTAAARGAEAAGAALIVAAGGDGTVFRVVNGLERPETHFGILPVGTANDLASFLGMPMGAVEAARAIVERPARRIDAVRVTPDGGGAVRVMTVGGFAVVADAAIRADRMKRRWPWVGPVVYKIAAAVSIAIHGGAEAPGTFVSNQPILGGNLRLPFDGRVDDGVCEIATLAGGSRIRLARTLAAMSAGKALPAGALRWESVSSVVLQFAQEVDWFADGEGLGRGKTFRVDVEPGSVVIRGAKS